jgi:hypothetical protein
MKSGNLLAIMSALRPRATELLHRNELPLCAISRHMHCTKFEGSRPLVGANEQRG